MKKKFLTKNTKIIIKEEKPVGLKTAEYVHNEDGKINKTALKDFAKKLKDYYDFDDGEENALENPPKVGRDDELEEYEVEAKGAGKMSSYKYNDEDTEVYEKFVDRVDDLNDTSEYDKNFGTTDGFGAGKKDNVWNDVKKYSDKYKQYKYDEPDEYQQTPRVRVTKGVSESKDNKKKKMKRLNFKNKFTTEYEMKELIPENYKTDGHTFLMADGNQMYKVRWDETLKDGTVLGFKNKSQINESVKKMKKLYNYQYSDSQSKTNDYITETDMMKKLMKKPLITEQLSQDNKQIVIDCVIENTELEDLQNIPEACLKMIINNDVTQLIACGSAIDQDTAKTIFDKIVPIGKCVSDKLPDGIQY